jgi:hypothetical protein
MRMEDAGVLGMLSRPITIRFFKPRSNCFPASSLATPARSGPAKASTKRLRPQAQARPSTSAMPHRLQPGRKEVLGSRTGFPELWSDGVEDEYGRRGVCGTGQATATTYAQPCA